MTVRKVNLYSLGAYALFIAGLLWLAKSRGNNNLDWGDVVFFLFTALIAWAVGLLVGLVLSVIVKKPKVEPYFYLSGQIAVVSTLIIIMAVTGHDEAVKVRAVENIRANHDLVDLENREAIPYRMDYVRTAFLKLESASGDPNSFHLERFSSRYMDTLVNSAPDTIFSVLFTYIKNDQVRFANVVVLDDSAEIKTIDAERKPAFDTRFINHGVWSRPMGLDEVNSRLKELPDSMRKRIDSILAE